MEIIEQMLKFRSDRDWEQFHKPKDLAISLTLEAAELLECFQWKTDAEIEELLNDPKKKKEIEEEIADIAIYLHLLCHDLNIDLDDVIKEKIKANELKYPVEKSKGNAKKHTEL